MQSIANADATAILPYVITTKVEVALGVVELTLRHELGYRLPEWTPGSHIDLILPNGLTRQYSLCGDRWDAYSYRVAVLRENNGRGGSTMIHDQLSIGDHVGIGGPRNNFPMVPSENYAFIGGGIGITPLLPMINQARGLGANWRLLYGGRTKEAMAYLNEIAEFGGDVIIVPEDREGLLPLSDWISELSKDVSKLYVCGPSRLLDVVEALCADWPVGGLRTERFVPKLLSAPVRSAPFDVELARSGRTVTVPPDSSILDVVREVGVNVLSSCREGTCGTCQVTVLSGQPEHRDSVFDDDERERNDAMFVCVSRSCSDKLVLDL